MFVLDPIGDVGDWTTADDPTPDEVTDPDDPSWVAPWRPPGSTR